MKTFCICLMISLPLLVVGQEDDSSSNSFNLSLASGTVMASVKDQNISSQRYSGTLTPIVFSWGHYRKGYDWDLKISYASGTINNYNVRATLNDFNMTWNYLYPIKDFQLISNRPTSWFGGLSPNLWMYYRKQEIAEPGQFLYSVKIALNMSLSTGLKGSLSNKIGYRISSRFNLISYALSSEVNEGNTGTSTKLSTVFSTPLLESELAMHYQLISWLKMGLGYRFKYYNHESLSLANDSFTVSLSATF